MAEKIFNVLLLCTGNSARSIMAEAILNRLGAGRFKAYSAGSHPKGEINPYTLATLRKAGFLPEGYRSKSWDEFAAPGSPPLHFVFTVCDDAAKEQCPYWPGQPMTAHWGQPDPAAFKGTLHGGFARRVLTSRRLRSCYSSEYRTPELVHPVEGLDGNCNFSRTTGIVA
jgi:protein-tyrosine-phosphatase